MPKGLIMGAAMLAAAAACAPIVELHGYAPTQDQLTEIQPGVDNVQTVARKIGRPATGGLINSTSWYYVSSRYETRTYNAPELIDRRVVAVNFSQDGLVNDVAEYGVEDGRVINLVTRTTPTYGKQLTVLEQLFGNLGSVSAGDLLSPNRGPGGGPGGI